MDIERRKTAMNQTFSSRKAHIFLAGDSTMQAYPSTRRPQFGWGEALSTYVDNRLLQTFHRSSCSFEQQKSFETPNYIIDNCGMAGRSIKSFIHEQRHLDIFNHMEAYDYLLIEFGHNDIAKDKPERYVPLTELHAYYSLFIQKAHEKKVQLIILSPILIDIYSHNDPKLHSMVQQLKSYVVEIESIARQHSLPFIHVGKMALQSFYRENPIHPFSHIENLYLDDHVHLTEKGAHFYGHLIGNALKNLI